MAYATEAELAAYLGISEDDLPDDSERLLNRASEYVDYLTMGRIDPNNEAHAVAARQAACAQVEAWFGGDESADIQGNIRAYSIGRFSIDFAGRGNSESAGMSSGSAAPRARRALFLAGLLYRGVGMR